MALNVFELFGKIAIDSNDAKSGIDSAVGHAENAENKLAKTFKKIGTAFAAAFSVKAIIDFGKQCTETYASIAAEESAFAQIMGDYTETAQAKMDAVAEKTGVVSTRLTASMTSLTAKFKGLGYNVEDATTLAADGLLIASDAAAFWDMSLDDAMSHLNSFINGSYEGGEAIGLFANDTQMAAYAVEKGIVADTKAWSALDEATKQATRLDYAKNMQEQSGATGQAAKESQEYANVMANLKEHWRQFLGVVGKPILEKMVLPALQKLNDFVPKLTESVQNGIVWLEEGFDKIASYFTDVFTEDGLNLDALPDALSNMFRDLGRSAGRLLTNFGRTLKNGWSNTVWPLIQKTFKATFGIDVPEWSEMKGIITAWWDGGNGIAAAIADVCNWTLNLFGAPADVTAEDVSFALSTWWTNTRNLVQQACDWTLALFNPPEGDGENGAVSIITAWWNGIKEKVEEVCSIDLSKVNVSGIFTAGKEAYDRFIATCSDFVNDVLKAVSSNPNGEVVLSARLSGLFDAGVNAQKNILSIASTLVADVVGAITGNEEDSKKIGEAFSELFGVASEIVIGAKDGALGFFQWLFDNGNVVAGIIGAIAAKTLMFVVAASPAAMVIAAITTLIGALTIDWKNFESNYPQLVQMFEDLTGLDFTNVANSLDAFQTKMKGIVDWFKDHETVFNSMLIVIGGVLTATGHPVAGAALIGAGASDMYSEFINDWKEDFYSYRNEVSPSETVNTLGEVIDALDANGLISAAHAVKEYRDRLIQGDVEDREREETALVNYLRGQQTYAEENGQDEFAKTLGALIDKLETQAEETQYRDHESVGAPTPEWFTYDDVNTGGNAGNASLIGALLQQLSTQKAEIIAATKEGVSEGLSGVTINAYVTPGDVKIDGKIVGTQTAPYVNFQLGRTNKLDRG